MLLRICIAANMYIAVAIQRIKKEIILYTDCFSEQRLGCFTYYFFHAALMLTASVSIATKLAMAVRSKRALTQMSSDKSGSGREMQAAVTVCTIALLQCVAYFPTAVLCMAICLANESPQFEIVRLLGLCDLSLTLAK